MTMCKIPNMLVSNLVFQIEFCSFYFHYNLLLRLKSCYVSLFLLYVIKVVNFKQNIYIIFFECFVIFCSLLLFYISEFIKLLLFLPFILQLILDHIIFDFWKQHHYKYFVIFAPTLFLSRTTNNLILNIYIEISIF